MQQVTRAWFDEVRITSYNVCYTKLLRDALGRGHKMGFVLTAPQPWCERLAARLKGREQPPVEMDMEPLSAAEQRTCLQYYLLRGNYPLDQGRWDALERLLSAVTGWPVELVALAEKTMSSKKSSFRRNNFV